MQLGIQSGHGEIQHKTKWKSRQATLLSHSTDRQIKMRAVVHPQSTAKGHIRVKQNVTHSHKRGLRSLGLIRATGKEVKDNHYVLHLTPTLQLAITFLSFEIRI